MDHADLILRYQRNRHAIGDGYDKRYFSASCDQGVRFPGEPGFIYPHDLIPGDLPYPGCAPSIHGISYTG
jgi:hypothetical protein